MRRQNEDKNEVKYPFANVEMLRWWADTTEELQSRFLNLIKPGLKRGMLLQWINLRRGISASVSGDIEKATLTIAEDTPGVQVILRGDVCEACSRCSYYLDRNCKKEKNE